MQCFVKMCNQFAEAQGITFVEKKTHALFEKSECVVVYSKILMQYLSNIRDLQCCIVIPDKAARPSK